MGPERRDRARGDGVNDRQVKLKDLGVVIELNGWIIPVVQGVCGP